MRNREEKKLVRAVRDIVGVEESKPRGYKAGQGNANLQLEPVAGATGLGQTNNRRD